MVLMVYSQYLQASVDMSSLRGLREGLGSMAAEAVQYLKRLQDIILNADQIIR